MAFTNIQQNNLPKVLVACPTYQGMSYCLDQFLNRMKALSYKAKEILLVDNSETEEYYNKLISIPDIVVIRHYQKENNPIQKIINSRNKILEYAILNDFDYVLMMDQDVIPPEEIIESLLACEKDIVSGLYFNYFLVSGTMKILPVAWCSINEEEFQEIKNKMNLSPLIKSKEDIRRHLTQEEIESGEIIEVLLPSAGCMLISRAVFSEINYELPDLKSLGVVNSDIRTSDDVGFIMKVRRKGFKIYCYTKIKCDHLVSKKYSKDLQGNFVYKAILKE